MFQVKENDCVGFQSKWKVKKVYYESSSQTSEIEQIEKGINTVVKNEIETQTETDSPKQVLEEINMQKLADFLARVYPMVKQNIDDANNSQAFKNYTLHDINYDEEIKILQKLSVCNSEIINLGKFRVSALSWNCTGQSLAVSCNLAHKSWCLHPGFVNIYTFDRNDKFPETPRIVLTTNACVTVVNYHPTLPSVLVAGTFSGDLYAWNIIHSENDNLIIKINAHEESVTQIAWIYDIDLTKSIILASSSIDGFLNLWNFNLTTFGLRIKEKYKFKPPISARVGNKKLVTEEISNKHVRGVLCFDFSPHINDTFMVGLEGGLVVQCSMLGTNKLKGSTDEAPISNPVFKYYEPLHGEIISISFSRNHKDMFMTNSADSEVRIYIIGTDEPAKIIFTKDNLSVVSFIPNEEKLIAGCGVKGCVEVYNILNGRKYENTLRDHQSSYNLTEMAINKKRPTTVAVGNLKSEIQVLHIPWRTFSCSQVQFA